MKSNSIFDTVSGLHLNNHEVNSRNTLFMLQNDLPGMCTCMYVIGENSALPDDFVLHRRKSWV